MRRIFSYDATNEADFSAFCEEAAKLGATHVFVSRLPKSRWQWQRDLSDPYPNWGMMHSSIFKVVVPDELAPWLPRDYAEGNLEMVSRRCRILEGLGLKPAFSACEPGWLPEEVYRAHPQWRGPRCEHTRRARKAYYSPCIDNAEVLGLYRRAVEELCSQAPIEFFQFLTNDSGGGVCWSQGLYPGANGPTACEHRPFGERIVGFMSMIQHAAARGGLQAEVCISGSIPSHEVTATVPHLRPGQCIQGWTADGGDSMRSAGFLEEFYGSDVYPVVGIPQPVRFLGDLQQLGDTARGTVVYGIPQFRRLELMELIRRHSDRPAAGVRGSIERLADVAEVIAGRQHADSLLEAWVEIDRAVVELSHMRESGPILLLGCVNQRWLTRPLVPFPLELPEEDRAYYRRFQFQANTEREAADLMDLQGIWMVKGFAARYLAEQMFTRAEAHITAATRRVESIAEASDDADVTAAMAAMGLRLRALACVIRTALHACQYQEILDRTDFEQIPEETPVWHVPADPRGYEIRQVARREIDNTHTLIDLLSTARAPLLDLAPSSDEEDVFRLGPDLIEQLSRKVRIMLDHEMDYNRLYARFNGLPARPSGGAAFEGRDSGTGWFPWMAGQPVVAAHTTSRDKRTR